MVEVKKDPRYRVGTRFIKQTAKKILKNLGPNQRVDLSIALVGKRQAKKLNQVFRGQDYIPAVLSFPDPQKTPETKFLLGEVMICFPLVREKAIRENQTIEEALADLLKHGIKNLLGI